MHGHLRLRPIHFHNRGLLLDGDLGLTIGLLLTACPLVLLSALLRGAQLPERLLTAGLIVLRFELLCLLQRHGSTRGAALLKMYQKPVARELLARLRLLLLRLRLRERWGDERTRAE
jgi:hypothetical protein